jgi:hypothetical protein
MSKKRQERKGSTRRSKSIPDDLAIDGIISGLDVQEGNDRVMTMLQEVSMHKLMKAHGLIESTAMRTETTLGEIKGRRKAGKKRSKREFKKLTEDGCKRDGTVVRRERGITFFEDGNNLGVTPERRNERPLPAKSEKQGEERSNNSGEGLKHFSTDMIGTRSFTGRQKTDIMRDQHWRERR